MKCYDTFIILVEPNPSHCLYRSFCIQLSMNIDLNIAKKSSLVQFVLGLSLFSSLPSIFRLSSVCQRRSLYLKTVPPSDSYDSFLLRTIRNYSLALFQSNGTVVLVAIASNRFLEAYCSNVAVKGREREREKEKRSDFSKSEACCSTITRERFD